MRLPPPLRRPAFRAFFAGQSASLLGDEVATLAVPLTAVLVLHAGPVQLGLLTAAGIVPSLLFSLPAGAWIDRRGGRRPIMLVADAVRCLALASLPITYLAGSLSLVQLYVVALVVGSLDVLFFVSYNAFVVALVEPAELVDATALLNGSRSAAAVVGQTLGGTLVGLLTAPGALALDAVSFAISGFGIARARVDEPAAHSVARGGIADGARWIRRDPVIGPMLASTAWVCLATFVGQAVLVLYASRTLHLGPTLIGLAFGTGAVGGVLGALTARRVERRIGIGMTFVVGSVVYPVPWLLFPAAHGSAATAFAFVAVGEFVSFVGVVWLDTAYGAIFGQVVPEPLRSRVAGAYRTVNYGVRPLGAVIGGGLGAAIGLRDTLWIAAGTASCAAVPVLRRSMTTLRSPTGAPPVTAV